MKNTPKPKTPKLLLDTAESLMLREGYRAVSIDRIIETAGVSKGTFFYYFSSKEILAIEMFERFLQTRGADMRESMEALANETDPLIRLQKFITGLKKIFSGEGCLVGSVAYQLVEEIPTLKNRANESLTGWTNFFLPYFEAIENQYGKKKSAPNTLAIMLFSLVQGSMVVKRINNDPTILDKQLDEFNQYLALIYSSKA